MNTTQTQMNRMTTFTHTHRRGMKLQGRKGVHSEANITGCPRINHAHARAWTRCTRTRVFDEKVASDCKWQDIEAIDVAFELQRREEVYKRRKWMDSSEVLITAAPESHVRSASHGGLGLLMLIIYGLIANSRRFKRRAEMEEDSEVLKQKQDWLKSRTLQAVVTQSADDKAPEFTEEFPKQIADKEEQEESQPSWETQLQGDYDDFLRDSKTDRVLAPSDSYTNTIQFKPSPEDLSK